MSLYEDWISTAYDSQGSAIKKHWDDYVPKEQKIYETIIGEKISHIEGTVKELSARFHITVECVCGLLDGLNESFEERIEIKELKADDVVSVDINFESLFRKMVDYKAEHLYSLPEWDGIFTKEKQHEIYVEQRRSRTLVKEVKIGRNELCSCGSGKKYKKCCGA
jgi:uncharacterized protein